MFHSLHAMFEPWLLCVFQSNLIEDKKYPQRYYCVTSLVILRNIIVIITFYMGVMCDKPFHQNILLVHIYSGLIEGCMKMIKILLCSNLGMKCDQYQ